MALKDERNGDEGEIGAIEHLPGGGDAPARHDDGHGGRQSDTWIVRLANEVYLGALVLGGVIVVAGIVALVIALALQVSNWVKLAD